MIFNVRKLPVIILAALMSILSASAQTTSTTGSIAGRVLDNSGSALPGVTVTASNVDTGLVRTAVTEGDGSYRVQLLPPGTYRVEAELSGLGTARRDRITVLLGSSSSLDLAINPQISDEITVTASAPVVDVRQSGLTTAVTESQIENLPILGRDFRDLALLTPGAVTTFGDRVALNGARGIATTYNIDGADTNSDFFGEQRGGTRAPYTFSQAAIREFQVLRSTFSAEYSRSVGATLNAITKSGTNEFDGQVFFFRRDKEWASERPNRFRGLPITDTFEAKDVDQYGFAFGGPIVRDRLHFFLNTDFQDFSRGVNAFDFRTDPDFAGLPVDTRNAFISRVEQLLGGSLANEFGYQTAEDQRTYLAKLDANLGSKHHLSVRDNFSEFENFGSEGTNPRSAQGTFANQFNTAVLQSESVFTNSMFNQAILQLSKEERPRTPVNDRIPYTRVFGEISYSFGQLDFLPNNLIEDKLQLKDTLSINFGQHSFRTGFEYVKNELDNLFPRDFAGEYQYSNVADFLANRPSRFQQGLGPVGIEQGNNQFEYEFYGVFVHDTWTPTPKLTLDLGVRYDYQTVPEPIRNVTPYASFVSDFQEDDDNVAPRLGFAYDIKGDGRSVVRGGAGLYYQFLPSILLADPLANIGGLYTTIDVVCSATNPCPTYPNLLGRTDFDRFARSSTTIRKVSKDLEAQESTRIVLGFEQALGSAYSVGLEGTHAMLEKQQRLVNVNAVPTGLSFGNLILYNLTNPNRLYPAYTTVQEHVSDASAEYTSFSVVAKRLSTGNSRFSWLAHYTWSEAIDQDSNERSTSTSLSLDPFDPELSEGRADYDVTHKVVLSGSYELPFGILVSGIYNWRTGIPYTMNVGGINNGLGDVSAATPVFIDRDGNVIDLTQANGTSRVGFSEFLASRGAQLQERNSENQPNFRNLDARLSKRFKLFSDFQIELIGEVFNVVNRQNRFIPGANQRQFTASYNTAQDRFTITRNANYGIANSYSNASDPRQYQVALKLHF